MEGTLDLICVTIWLFSPKYPDLQFQTSKLYAFLSLFSPQKKDKDPFLLRPFQTQWQGRTLFGSARAGRQAPKREGKTCLCYFRERGSVLFKVGSGFMRTLFFLYYGMMMVWKLCAPVSALTGTKGRGHSKHFDGDINSNFILSWVRKNADTKR